jgi:protein-tyrosine phosphatase
MGRILVVCTGNVCRSPLGEGFVRRALVDRLGADAPEVRSAGTAGWEGSGATPESVRAGAEHGLDLASHRARRLSAPTLDEADLVITMAGGHRDEIAALAPAAAARTYTLKELVRLLEALDPLERPSAGFADRVGAAETLRRGGFEGNPMDEDVVDPLGMPIDTYRAIAWEIEQWSERLGDSLVGPRPAGAPVAEPSGEASSR